MVETFDQQVYVDQEIQIGETLIVHNELYAPVEVRLSIESARHLTGNT
jgi:hypothetical protein